MTLEIIRHGETALQVLGKYQGSTNVPLSPEGKGKLLKAPFSAERVYVSRMQRAQETAEILFPESEKIITEGIQEFDFGAFEGRSWQEMENDPDYRAWVESGCTTQCPGGESRALLEARVCPAVLEILRKEISMGSEAVTIVAHGGTQMAVGEILVQDDARDYWAWGLHSGEGWVFEVGNLNDARPLKAIKQTKYTI